MVNTCQEEVASRPGLALLKDLKGVPEDLLDMFW